MWSKNRGKLELASKNKLMERGKFMNDDFQSEANLQQCLNGRAKEKKKTKSFEFFLSHSKRHFYQS